jgi:uncharacterized sulfatase
MVDTQRRDMVGCYPDSKSLTPNLKALAERGRAYNRAYTCSPVCAPARSALFTGLYPHSNGVVANSTPLGQGVKNAGQWLSPHGIECGYIGKWHLDGGDYFGYGRCPEGYNPRYWYDMKNYLDSLPDDEARIRSRIPMPARDDDPPEEDTYAHRCCDKAIDFLEEFKDKNFFLTLSLDEPHDPYVCPRRYMDALDERGFRVPKKPNYRADLSSKPLSHRIWAKRFESVTYDELDRAQKGLFACNEFCDYEIGRVLDKVEELGLEPMIIYTADHGDMLLSHGIAGKGCAMYEEITNIPLIISVKGQTLPGSDVPVSHLDLLPTLMKYLDVKIPKPLQGKALQDIKDENRYIFLEYTRYETDHDGFMGYQPIRCVTDGRYKLVINLLDTDELYDLGADPYEKENLIHCEKYKEIRNELHDILIAQMDDTRDNSRGYQWLCRPWREGAEPSFDNSGMTRQAVEEDYVQLDYSTGLPMKDPVRKK